MVEPPVTQTVRLIVQDNPQQFVGYATDTGISITAEEVVLHFGLRSSGPDPLASVMGVAKLYLSLPHTKRLVAALVRSLESYESTLGEIDADPNARLLRSVQQNKQEVESDGDEG